MVFHEELIAPLTFRREMEIGLYCITSRAYNAEMWIGPDTYMCIRGTDKTPLRQNPPHATKPRLK